MSAHRGRSTSTSVGGSTALSAHEGGSAQNGADGPTHGGFGVGGSTSGSSRRSTRASGAARRSGRTHHGRGAAGASGIDRQRDSAGSHVAAQRTGGPTTSTGASRWLLDPAVPTPQRQRRHQRSTHRQDKNICAHWGPPMNQELGQPTPKDRLCQQNHHPVCPRSHMR